MHLQRNTLYDFYMSLNSNYIKMFTQAESQI